MSLIKRLKAGFLGLAIVISFNAYGLGNVCETETYNAVTEEGKSCVIEIYTTRRAAFGGRAGTIC